MNKPLLDLLEKSSAVNPTTYEKAREILGSSVVPSERQFRRDIAEFREHGIRAISNVGKGGYWVSRNDNEYIAYRNSQLSRVKKIVSAVKQMDGNLVGQEQIKL